MDFTKSAGFFMVAFFIEMKFFAFKYFQGPTSGFSKDLLPSENFQSEHLQSEDFQ